MCDPRPRSCDGCLVYHQATVTRTEDGEVEYCAPGLETWCPQSGTGLEITLTDSASRPGHGPELVRDGSVDGESFWSSGDDPPGWLQIDFAGPTVVEAVRFVV